jgi:hypothetical protein
VGLVLFIAFGRGKPIPKYEAEISRLETINSSLEFDNTMLMVENEASKKKLNDLDDALLVLTDELETTQSVIDFLTKIRENGKSNYVNQLPDDAVAGEIAEYLKRRKAKRGS